MATGLNQYNNITTATTTTVRTGKGKLSAIVCNKAVVNQVITIYDSITAANTKIGTITEPATLLESQWALRYDVCFQTGLTIVTGAAEDLTVCWEPM